MQNIDFYTLENYDTVSMSCLSSHDDNPFVLFGYPENNITLLQTKYNNVLYPCELFTENEIGFGKETSIAKSINNNLFTFVIAQNELDSSTTYIYEYLSNNKIYDFSKNIRSKLSNINQTITNSLSTCCDNKGNMYCIIFGYDLLSDKGGCVLHTKMHDSTQWTSTDITKTFGNNKLIGYNSSLNNINGNIMLFTLNKSTNIINVFRFETMEKIFEKNYDNIINIDVTDEILLICDNINIKLLSIDNNFEEKLIIGIGDGEIKNANIIGNDIIVSFMDNSVQIYDVTGKLKRSIKEKYKFTTGIFYDNVENLNICLLKNQQFSNLRNIKQLQIYNLKCDNPTKDSLNVTYIGNNEETTKNSLQRANILKYLFDEYFDTLDSNAFTAYRCFFLKLFLDKTNTFLENTSKMYFNTIINSGKQYQYENINKLKLCMTDMCILGYVTSETDAPTIFTNDNKYICFRYNNENYFPNGKMGLFDEKNIETIDLILESKIVNITSLNYISIANMTLKDIIKTHFFTHKKNEDDESKYIIWKTLDGKKLDFPLFGLKDIFYNCLNTKIEIKLQITSILEDFYYDIEPVSLNGYYIGENENEIVLYQNKMELINNSIEDTEKFMKMVMINCNDI